MVHQDGPLAYHGLRGQRLLDALAQLLPPHEGGCCSRTAPCAPRHLRCCVPVASAPAASASQPTAFCGSPRAPGRPRSASVSSLTTEAQLSPLSTLLRHPANQMQPPASWVMRELLYLRPAQPLLEQVRGSSAVMNRLFVSLECPHVCGRAAVARFFCVLLAHVDGFAAMAGFIVGHGPWLLACHILPFCDDPIVRGTLSNMLVVTRSRYSQDVYVGERGGMSRTEANSDIPSESELQVLVDLPCVIAEGALTVIACRCSCGPSAAAAAAAAASADGAPLMLALFEVAMLALMCRPERYPCPTAQRCTCANKQFWHRRRKMTPDFLNSRMVAVLRGYSREAYHALVMLVTKEPLAASVLPLLTEILSHCPSSEQLCDLLLRLLTDELESLRYFVQCHRANHALVLHVARLAVAVLRKIDPELSAAWSPLVSIFLDDWLSPCILHPVYIKVVRCIMKRGLPQLCTLVKSHEYQLTIVHEISVKPFYCGEEVDELRVLALRQLVSEDEPTGGAKASPRDSADKAGDNCCEDGKEDAKCV
eukprot:TRINITY_DN7264_c0_g1_i2.p1 TRINITY_DN7264_c0_g1~~TRINITY_DN7264_c0_g1_i2.p1  ORF type:complete len:537 (-),score=104.04 TRINITY_DN7264_c0_g1_i2:46-1656(-)